ncbi:MAG: terminase gpA endonuclease subunit [Gemmatales bacterium]
MTTSDKNTISRYAQRVGVNPDSGEPYSLEGYEYLQGPMDCLAERVVIMKAAQVGATVMAMLRTMWYLENQKRSAMYLFPTHRTAERFRRGRFSVMVARSPFFHDVVKATGAPGHLRVGTAQFYCHGARSRAELMSVPIAYLTLDERDELYRMAGLEGTAWSAVDLARQRLAGQPRSWELSLSTPTIPGHGIAAEYDKCVQSTFLVVCPLCRQRVGLSWPASIQGLDGHPDRARYCCSRCRRPWSQEVRRQAMRSGAWFGAEGEEKLVGFHLNQLMSPVAEASRLVRQWQEAQGDPAALQVFHNAVLGQPYLAEGARLEMAVIEAALARSQGATMAVRADRTAAGIDVGPHHLHVVITQVVEQLCRVVWAGVVLQWDELKALLVQYGVQSFVIDAQPETHQARQLVRQHPGGWMCYYRSEPGAQPLYDGAQRIVRVPRSESLDRLYQAWNQGQVVAPVNLPGEFAGQLRSPVRVVRQDRRGNPRVDYLQAGGADHYAHAMNYSLLALGLLGPAMAWRVG